MRKYALFLFFLLNSNIAFADPRIHIGGGIGYSIPLQSSFIDEDTKSKVSFTGSKYYNIRLGYEFAPGIRIELDGARHPDYKFRINLKDNQGKARTNATCCDLHANIIYDLNPIGRAVPFFLFGLGGTNINLGAMEITQSNNSAKKIFKSDKQNHFCKSWNAGLGFYIPLGPNVDFEISGKILSISDIKIDYKTEKMVDNSIKKTLRTIEFAIGTKIKF
jgi:hypothetical protein